MQRNYPVLLVCCAFAFACGSDDPPANEADIRADVGDTSDAAPDTVEDAADVEPDVVCELECTRAAECLELGSGALCIDGCCSPPPPPPDVCLAHGDECESDEQSTDSLICDTGRGLCLSYCDQDFAAETESADCPDQSYCFRLNTPVDAQRDGLCLPNECTNIFDQETCEGVGTCVAYGNNASFCFTAGTAENGDECGQDDSGNPPASDICAPGLRCAFDQCVRPCDLRNGDDDCADDGLDCVRAWDATITNRAGICAADCDEFDEGLCTEEGSRCGPFFGRARINNWFCYPPADTLLDDGAECGDGIEGECSEGLTCSTIRGDTATCNRFCNPLGSGSGGYVDCPAGIGPGAVVIAPTNFGDVSEFISVATGTHDLSLWDDSGNRLGGITVTANEGLAQTLVVADDGAGGIVVVSLGERAGDVTTGLRVLNVSTTGEPSVSIDGGEASVIASGASSPAEGYVAVDSLLPVTITVDGAPWAVAVDADALVTAVLHGTDDYTVFHIGGGEDAGAEAGDSLVRLINAVDGVSGISLTEIAEPSTVCVPGGQAEFGTCREACAPYPRGAGSYGCDEESDTCVPFDIRSDRAVAANGYCGVEEGFAGPWDDCSNTGFFGQDCEDYAACLDRTGESLCHPLCEPYGEQGCAEDETCDGDQVIRGRLSRSWCLQDPQPGTHGDRCTAEGEACGEDLTLCLDLQSTGPVCRRVCRSGFDDCDDIDDSRCDADNLNASVVPPYMGFCTI